jgi:vancomycin resistance protein YoaR
VTSTPPSPSADRPSSPSARRGATIAAISVGAVATVYLALVATTGDGLPRGSQVLGVDVGGQTEQQAVATLTSALGERADSEMVVVVDGKKVTIVPSDSGLAFDADATVSGYAGRIWNPVTLLTQFTGGPTIDPVVTVDEAKLDETVATLAADVDEPAVEPSIEYAGLRPKLTEATSGTVLDRAASAEAIRTAYLVSTAPVVLPIVDSEPTVSSDTAAQSLSVAKTAVEAPVTVKVDGITATIPPATIAKALTFPAKDGKLEPVLDGDVLRAAIAGRIASIESPGRDAGWKIVAGKPVVVPSKVGRGVNAELLATDVAGVLAESDATARTITAQIGTIEPKLTTEKAKTLGVVEKMSSFQQNFPYAAYRVQNIGTAARYINNTLLMPGETFSLNDTIKERTVANGYTKGFVVGEGGVFKEDLGGGVSTSATTTWTAAFYAGLERVHTQAHSIWISRYRAGLEATVAWGQFDMTFRNDTKSAVLIKTTMRNTSLTVSMYGTKVYDKVRAVSGPRENVRPFKTLYDDSSTCHAQAGSPGFSIVVTRVFYKGGEVVKREPIRTVYRPSPTVKCGVDPAKKPTPSPSPSGSGKPSPSGSTKPSPSPSPSKTR